MFNSFEVHSVLWTLSHTHMCVCVCKPLFPLAFYLCRFSFPLFVTALPPSLFLSRYSTLLLPGVSFGFGFCFISFCLLVCSFVTVQRVHTLFLFAVCVRYDSLRKRKENATSKRKERDKREKCGHGEVGCLSATVLANRRCAPPPSPPLPPLFVLRGWWW